MAEVDVNGVYVENGVPHACAGSIHITNVDTDNAQVSGSFSLSTTLSNGQTVTIQSGTFENIPF